MKELFMGLDAKNLRVISNNYSGQGLARYGAAGYSIELETNFTSFHNHGECLY